MDLSQKHCIPCEGGTPPLDENEIKKYSAEAVGWNVSENKKISGEFKFGDFKEAMAFVNMVAEIAETEDHHPDIYVSYNKVRLELSTHAIGGLSENDFILAAKINAVSPR